MPYLLDSYKPFLYNGHKITISPKNKKIKSQNMDGKKQVEFYKGQRVDEGKTLQQSNIFYNNPRLFIINKKAEKLSLAVYMITDLFDVREPLKWELRIKATSLLSFISSRAGDRALEEGSYWYGTGLSYIDQVLVLLELAVRTGLISPMNFSILKEEFLSLSDLLQKNTKSSGFSNTSLFPNRFFEISDIKDNTSSKELLRQESYKTDSSIKDNKGQKDSKGHFYSEKGQFSISSSSGFDAEEQKKNTIKK